MVVTATDIFGSIGGGNLELNATTQAREMLEKQGALEEHTVILGPERQQCCGGTVTYTLELIDHKSAYKHLDAATLTPVFLFGAGHVGTALCTALSPLPFHVQVFDSRADKQAQGLGDIDTILSGAPDDVLFLVMTHDHAQDYDLVRAILSRDAVRYCGMIGSKTKQARFMSRLKKDGLSSEQLARLTCPIGIEGIEGKEPEIIAASVAAQLLQQLGDPNEH